LIREGTEAPTNERLTTLVGGVSLPVKEPSKKLLTSLTILSRRTPDSFFPCRINSVVVSCHKTGRSNRQGIQHKTRCSLNSLTMQRPRFLAGSRLRPGGSANDLDW